MDKIELYGSQGCPHTREMREWLEFRGVRFVEYDVDADSYARARLRTIMPSSQMIPVLVTNGTVSLVGWQGRGCVYGA
jgi:glutaredoxin 3